MEVIGDPVLPSVLLLPIVNANSDATAAGTIYLSGAKLIFSNGTKWETITSA